MTDNFAITDSAAKRIKEIVSTPDFMGKRLRITVQGGGCSGFKYDLIFDSTTGPTDITFKHNDVEILIDDISLTFLKNSTLDFVEDIGSAGFEIKNPNATAKCGCGDSFSI